MCWIHQRPTDGADWPEATCTSTSSRLRAPGVLRHVAAGELGSGLYLNPVAPRGRRRHAARGHPAGGRAAGAGAA